MKAIAGTTESIGHHPRRSDMPVKKCTVVVGTCVIVCSVAIGFRTLDAAQHDEKKAQATDVTKAIAQLSPTTGSSVKGTVVFTQAASGIHVHAEISGLTPGEHGFHVHEYGVWSENGMSAGGHFNPTMAQHAGIDSKKRHVGDLGNITANSNGNATLDVADSHLSLHGTNSILGRGVVVHEKADDLKSQPAGNAGARLAVGVVGVAKP
jgi:superoxide dismutase, Cu-Zn family